MATGVSVLVMNFYQPWIYGGAERFNQILREELGMGRSAGYVYANDADLPDLIASGVADPEYARLALYQLDGDSVRPRSPHAAALTGADPVSLRTLLDGLRPRYIRSHFPSAHFRPALEIAGAAGVPFVYDVMDLWDDFTKTPWGDSETERWYQRNALAVTAVSNRLVDRLPEGVPGHLVPNAVDSRFLRRIAPEGGVRRRAPGTRKRVLHLGTVWGNWFDWEVNFRLARELPECDFTYIGSLRPAPEEHDGRDIEALLTELDRPANVRVFEEVPHDELVPWLTAADVGIIPFHRTELTAAVSPLKVFEYLGAGSVVVSSDMPDIESYPAVHIARDADEFVKLVHEVDPLELSPADAEEMARFCAANTWADRVRALDSIVDGGRP
ncbi:glycosyltransferase family protein [Saccharothrix obliqua]|uniref:glycosyltransferase family protein n=1 Tax=Saccharothrix obliqua TaxID=2861747 RepID=UPI001C5CDE05|nr:glycosyltransferase [Saccharothrix obliqua]MBW4720408.1 glycosyltransferase [Saccharothrix obliqua]